MENSEMYHVALKENDHVDMLTCCQLCLGDSFTRRQNFQFEWHLTNIYAIYKDVTRRYIFFWKTFTKVSVRKPNMQQLNPEKIVLKLIITFSQKMETLHKLKRFDSANTLKHWVQAAVYVIEGKMFPALQFLFHLQWNYWLPSFVVALAIKQVSFQNLQRNWQN